MEKHQQTSDKQMLNNGAKIFCIFCFNSYKINIDKKWIKKLFYFLISILTAIILFL